MAPPRVRRAYPPGVVPRAQPVPLPADYLRLLEQKAYSGQTFLPADQFQNVLGGGYSNQLPAAYAPAPAAPKATAARDNAPASDAPLIPVRATEFGEVDRPSRGGYTEPNWNVGAWGHSLEGFNNQGVALPSSVLAQYGYNSKTAKTFGADFNSKYEVQVVDPKTGKVTVASLKDIGPGASTGAGLDMLGGTRSALGLPVNSSANLQYRVVPKGSDIPNKTTLVAAAAGQNGGDGTTSTVATGPIYISPVDRSKLKTPAGTGDLSTAEEYEVARARAEDWVQAIAKSGYQPTQKDYQEHLDAFASQVHALNQPPPGQQAVSAAQLAQTAPDISGIKMPTGVERGNLTNDQVLALATSNANGWVNALARQGQRVTQDEYRSELSNQYNGIQKLNMGLAPTAMSSADATHFSSLATAYDQLENFQGLHKKMKQSGVGALAGAPEMVADVAKLGGEIPVLGGTLTEAGALARKTMLLNASDDYKNFDSYRNLILPNLAKNLGGDAGSQLDDKKIQITASWMPNENDSPEVAATKTQDAQAEALTAWRDQLNLLKGAHVDTSVADQQYQETLAKFQQKVQAARDAHQPVGPLAAQMFPVAAMDASQLSARTSAAQAELKTLAGQTPAPAPPDQQQAIPTAAGGTPSKEDLSTRIPQNMPAPDTQIPMQPATAESVGMLPQDQDQQKQQPDSNYAFGGT